MRDIHPLMLEARIYELEQNGGGGGTADYEDLENKPKIENVELVGNLTFEDLGIASAEDLAQTNDDLSDVRQVANQNHANIATIDSKLGQVPDDESIEDQINDIKDNLSMLPKIYATQRNMSFNNRKVTIDAASFGFTSVSAAFASLAKDYNASDNFEITAVEVNGTVLTVWTKYTSTVVVFANLIIVGK